MPGEDISIVSCLPVLPLKIVSRSSPVVWQVMIHLASFSSICSTSDVLDLIVAAILSKQRIVVMLYLSVSTTNTLLFITKFAGWEMLSLSQSTFKRYNVLILSVSHTEKLILGVLWTHAFSNSLDTIFDAISFISSI